MIQLKKSGFKPQLLPNDNAGEVVDWHKRIKDPSEWVMSLKEDGIRVLILNTGLVLGRSLKVMASQHIQEMGKRFAQQYDFDGIVEAEFYCHGMNLPELVHFSRAQQVNHAEYRKKWQKQWDKYEGKSWMEDGAMQGWKFPGRDVDFLCRWDEELAFHIFDCFSYQYPKYTKEQRYHFLFEFIVPTNRWKVIPQVVPYSVDMILEFYSDAKFHKHEGLALFKRDSLYKFGRFTHKAAQGFKMKETTLEWDAEILSVAEGTYARVGSERTTNELGRSVTSKKKEDRIPGGYAKGFNVRLDDGRKLIVSLKGYDQAQKEMLWASRKFMPGNWIIIKGMAPVKEGGMPRSAHYIKGNTRDGK